MKKHKFNILPEMSPDEYAELLDNVRQHGYDQSQPVIVYQDEVLDGWHRYTAAEELNLDHTERPFEGTDLDAINFVLRTMTRRNLTSQQRAAIAVEADEIVSMLTEAVTTERRAAQAATQSVEKGAITQIIESQPPADEVAEEEVEETHYEMDEYSQVPPPRAPAVNRNKRTVNSRLAKSFNTNRTYVSDAMKLKETAPEKLEQVKTGETTFQQIKKEEALATTATDPNDSTRDEFTAIAEQLSKKVHKLLTEVKDVVTAARVQFTDKDQLMEVWAPRLDKAEFLFELNDCKKLRSLRVCPVCNGKQCEDCHELGYVSGTDFRTLSAGA